MTIKVLGPGCMNCKTLEKRTYEALLQLDEVSASVEKVEKVESIIAHGVVQTPGLVIDNAVVWQGSVPTVEKIKDLIKAAAARAPRP
jgi:small redox-active disulfide protein 2